MIRIIEDTQFKEAYKLDIQIEYSITNDEGAEVNSVPSKIVLDTLGETIEEEILQNKKYICEDNKFKDFNLKYSSYNDRDGILTFEVETEFKIIGQYFTDKVMYLLNKYKTIVYYNNREIAVTVESVYPMLRYIGSI